MFVDTKHKNTSGKSKLTTTPLLQYMNTAEKCAAQRREALIRFNVTICHADLFMRFALPITRKTDKFCLNHFNLN